MKIRLVYIIVALLILVSLQAGLAHQAGAQSGSLVAVVADDGGRNWTREEMLAAKPMPLPQVEAVPGPVWDDGPTRIPGFDDGSGAPVDLSRPLSPDLTEPRFSNLKLTADPGYNYPPPFTRYENFPTTTIATYKNFPYRTVGKLFFKQATKQCAAGCVCSASSIGNFAIWTAGHCLHSGGAGGAFSTNVVFVPAYRDGAAPYGQWKLASMILTANWVLAADSRYDYGGVVLNPLFGRAISQRVGNLGFAWNLPLPSVESHWTQIGYPAAPLPGGPRFNGKRQWICQSSVAYLDFRMAPPRPVGVGCDMTGGSSGGPWIISFSGFQGNTNFLNGNVSFGRVGFDLETYSPYFDDFTKVFKDCLVRSTPAAHACAEIISIIAR